MEGLLKNGGAGGHQLPYGVAEPAKYCKPHELPANQGYIRAGSVGKC